MKKILLLWIFSAACFFSKAQTNIYHPFPDSNAMWNISGVIPWGCPFNADYYEDFSMIISGDTTIGNYNYHKLFIPYIQKSCAQGGLHFEGYAGAFRDDTSARKIFFVHPVDSMEQLLYDFNMQVGDTVTGYLTSFWQCMPNALVVNTLDSVLIGNTYRKRWIIGTGWFKLIEGIGSTAGLLDPICEIIDGPITSLLCFSQNASALYPPNVTSCNLITNTESESEYNKNQILISPNPFHTTAKMEIGKWRLGNGKWGLGNRVLRIYNTMGVIVREENIQDLDSYILTRGSLSDGLYFFQLSTFNIQLIGSGKFIVE